jgi:RNA-binding protein
LNNIADKTLKAKAHALKPVVLIGQAGLTPPVLAEIELALTSHELIKVKIRAERDLRWQISDQICADSGALLVQSIGQIIVLFRSKPKKEVPLKRVKFKPKLKPKPKYTRSK